MPDLSSLSAALGSIKAASDLLKLIKDSNTSLEQAEVKLQMAEVISALADAKLELALVQDELFEKHRAIQDLTECLNQRNIVHFERPSYWVVDGDDRQGPFCQKCYDTERKLVRLQGGGTEVWLCHACNGTYADENYVTPTRRRNGPFY